METQDFASSTLNELPLLPLRDVVVYPHMVTPLFVGRQKSIEALEIAMAADKHVLLVAQKNPALDDPKAEDLYSVGTIASILQLLKLPDGTVKVLIEGKERAQIEKIEDMDTYFRAQAEPLEEIGVTGSEAHAMVTAAVAQFEQYVSLSKKVPSEVITSLSGIDDPGRLTDTISAHMSLELPQKQAILEIVDVRSRLNHLLALMDTEVDVFHVEK